MSVAAQRTRAGRGTMQGAAAPDESSRASGPESLPNDEFQSRVQVDSTVRRVLVFRLGSLGDTLVALPSLHLIAEAFPNAERRLLTNVPVVLKAPAAAAVLGESGLIHRYESYPAGTRNLLSLFRLFWRLRRFRPQVAIYLKAETGRKRSVRDYRFLRMTGARRVIGVSAGGEVQAFVAGDGTREPEVERLLRSLYELGSVDPGSRSAWELRLTEAETERAERVCAPFAGLPYFAASIGTKVQAKDWGVRNWADLLRGAASHYPGHGLLLAGAPEERQSSEVVAEAWGRASGSGPVVNACGKMTPRESAAAFRRARAFLGHDSGPMHLAAAVGAPVVAIFAARNQPHTWFPYGTSSRVLYHRVDCWGCGLETCLAQRKKCLLSITTSEVLTALRALVEGNA